MNLGDPRRKSAVAYDVRKRLNEGWLCACALLGINRTKDLMERRMLTLQDTELMLRKIVHPDLIPNGCGFDGTSNFSSYISTDKAITKLVPLFAELGFSRQGFEELIQQEKRQDEARRKKRGPLLEGKEFRSLRSWLLDECGEENEKLRIALGESTRDDRARRIKQLKQDSKAVLAALEKLRSNPLKIRRASMEEQSVATVLAKHSLRQQDRLDEEMFNFQEWLKSEQTRLESKALEAESAAKEAREKLRRIQNRLDFITEHRSNGKSGKRKRV